MTATENPALARFLAEIGDGLTLAQVLIRPRPRGYELRHESDRSVPEDELRLVSVNELRTLAQFTAAGLFRPLKSAPNLQRGWRAVAADEVQLEAALGHLYPGAVADWLAAQTAPVPVTHYREFTERQTGMYRITTLLNNQEAAETILACCHAESCRKRRLWTVPGLLPDRPEEKSLIPCLEPCAILLEFARMTVRTIQGEQMAAVAAPGGAAPAMGEEAAPLAAAEEEAREADFSSPRNRRRVRWMELRARRDATASVS